MYMPRGNKRIAGLPVAADYATYGIYVQDFPYYNTPQVPLVGCVDLLRDIEGSQHIAGTIGRLGNS